MNQELSLEQRWHFLTLMLQERFEKKPDMEAVLFLIGINEYRGRMPKYKFSKEEKQDLMHIAVCTVLSLVDYYEFEHYDQDGWPHFKELKAVPLETLKEQEDLLKACVLEYFEM